MPTSLTRRRSQQGPSRDKIKKMAAEAEAYVEKTTTGPWGGLMTDPDVSGVNYAGARDVRNLVARAVDDQGEMLVPDIGFGRIDSARLPLGDDGAGAPAAPAGAGDEQPITGIGLFTRYSAGALDDIQGMVMTGDTATTANGHLFRFNLTTGQWVGVASAGTGVGPPDFTGNSQIIGDRDNPFVSAVFPLGTTTRNDANAVGLPIAEPAFIFTNYADEVYVYPAGTGRADYSELVLDGIFGGSATFRSRSVEVFDERATFLNNWEGAGFFPRRLRWTPNGNCDPDTANVGTGFIDFNEFERQGLRNLRLSDVLVCYFEDGVAFVRRTEIPSAPLRRDYVSHQRGLISTHSVTKVGENSHFGIFNDGWFFLLPDKSWREVGIEEVTGARVHKWRERFYQRLDLENKQRLVCQYWPAERAVYIIVPVRGQDTTQEIWKFEIDHNRVWIRDVPATMLGLFDSQIAVATTYGGAAPSWAGLTYADLLGTTYGDYAARFGLDQLIHGTTDGLVMGYDPNIFTEDGTMPSYKYQAHELAHGEPNRWKTLDRVGVEYKNTGSGSCAATGVAGSVSQGGAIDMQRGSVGVVTSNYRSMRVAGPRVGYTLSGDHPVAIRSHHIRAIMNRPTDKRQ